MAIGWRWMVVVAVSGACNAARGGGSRDAAGSDTVGVEDAAGGDAVAAAPGGLGCACPEGACARGFCSTLSVCTTNDAVECDADADCGCDAQCVVEGDRRTCQIPCADAGVTCPGKLECGDVTASWTTLDGAAVTRACLAPAGPAGPTWEADIQPLVQAKCVGCHTGGATLGGLALDTYADTQRQIADCPAGAVRPVAEVMADKVSEAPSCGSRMPLGGALDPADVQKVADWVAAGAPER